MTEGSLTHKAMAVSGLTWDIVPSSNISSITLDYSQKMFYTLEYNSACRWNIHFYTFCIPLSFLSDSLVSSFPNFHRFFLSYISGSYFLTFVVLDWKKDIIHGKSKKLGAAQKSQKLNNIFNRLVLILTIFCS